MENIRGESRSDNYGLLFLDYEEGGDHIGDSSNIFERQSTIQSYTTGVSISYFPLAYSRQSTGTLTGVRFRYK